MIACATCGEAFDAKRRDARYCSARCRQIASRRGVTDNAPGVTDRVTDNFPGAVAVTDIDRLDELGARIQRGDRLTSAEIADAKWFCERILDHYDRSTDEAFIAFNVLARLDPMTEDVNADG